MLLVSKGNRLEFYLYFSSTMSKEGSEKLMVAAIDFGTTFSGYAFSFHHEFLRDPLKMNASQWSAGSKSEISLKTSSCILFDMNKTFVAFGLEAEDIYRNLTLDQLEGDWYYFRMIKMLLYNSQVGVILCHFQADYSLIYRQNVH